MDTAHQKIACGALFISATSGLALLNIRAPYKTHSFSWSLWGGMMEGDETPKETLLRELDEEMGFVPDIEKFYPFDIYESRDKHFRYYTFICIVEQDFIPKLNKEAMGYAWFDFNRGWPKPMHQGAKNSLCKPRALEKLNMILEQHKV